MFTSPRCPANAASCHSPCRPQKSQARPCARAARKQPLCRPATMSLIYVVRVLCFIWLLLSRDRSLEFNFVFWLCKIFTELEGIFPPFTAFVPHPQSLSLPSSLSPGSFFVVKLVICVLMVTLVLWFSLRLAGGWRELLFSVVYPLWAALGISWWALVAFPSSSPASVWKLHPVIPSMSVSTFSFCVISPWPPGFDGHIVSAVACIQPSSVSLIFVHLCSG